MLHYRHEAEGDDSYIDLYLDSIERCAVKVLYLQMLLESLEEEFYLPTIAI